MTNRWVVQYKSGISAGLVVFLGTVGFFVWMAEIATITFINLGLLAILLLTN